MTDGAIAAFIEANTTGNGVEFIRRARELGFAPALLTNRPGRYPFLQTLPRIEIHVCDTSSESAVSVCLHRIASKRPLALILSSSEFHLHMAARQAHRFGLGGPSAAAIALCRDKGRQADALAAAGVHVPPRRFTIRSTSQIPDAVSMVGLPAVIKPIDGAGSTGVRLARTETELATAAEALLGVRLDARGQSFVRPALVMSYVDGEQYSVEILDSQIIGVTKKHLDAPPYFVGTGHDYPAPISLELRRRIEGAARRAIEAVGHTRGAAHIELRVANGTPTIIEINPRLAGGSIPRLIRYATGLDLVAAVLESARAAQANIAPVRASFGSLRYLVPRGEGTFDLPCRLKDVVDRFGLAEIVLYRAVPLEFHRHHDFRDRVGHLIAVNADPMTAAHTADAAVTFLCHEPASAR